LIIAQKYGDRRQEIVVIGANMDKALISRKFDECLVSDEEFEQGPDAWIEYEDRWGDWDEEDDDAEEEKEGEDEDEKEGKEEDGDD
jgi:Cobalamin synthesis protein cobW C-terminal domain